MHERPQKVFVLGNQKSGSTAIAALLAECIGEAYFSDVLHTHKLQLKDLLEGRTSIAELRRDHPESFEAMVVKDNDFTFLYPSLAARSRRPPSSSSPATPGRTSAASSTGSRSPAIASRSLRSSTPGCAPSCPGGTPS